MTAHFLAYGVPFRLRADTPESLQAMVQVVPHGSIPTPDSPPHAEEFTLAEADTNTDADTDTDTDTDADTDDLRTRLMVHVADLAPDHVFLHAGVVSWKGRGIVLPGTSFAGKTTLVAHLVQAGCLYYSDEYAILSPAGLVNPYSRDLQVRAPGTATQVATHVARLGGRAGEGPLKIALIAFLQYDPGSAWSPQTVTPGMAVLQMLSHAIPVQRSPARVLASLTAMVSGALCFQTARGEAPAAAAELISLLEHVCSPD